MQWLKTWLRKWLNAPSAVLTDTLTVGQADLIKENAELILRLDSLESRARSQLTILSRFEDYITSLEAWRTHAKESSAALRAELIDIVKLGERDDKRISELETLVKDATLDTALAAVEDRVSKLESTPASTGPQGRRGGSAWNVHQQSASAGASLANGAAIPIPTPGVS